MARLQAMPLPPDGTPFILVVDEVNEADFGEPWWADALQNLKDQTGARFLLATTTTMDVV
ncbi:hypothetical protein [Streptomyces sp. SID2119]|uniref:hypothetical protein n=1 Tax=Streptomyces sp. SID2119 TaxID=2690253 RepID=UPI001369AACE|nr:hypothetical protein [Streptomyces sp. SID2119]MYW28294.1 hypothetical protein [Streptomyces sp. SID2119]